MAPKTLDELNEEPIFDETPDADDPAAELVRKMFEGDDDDAADEGGFDQPLDDDKEAPDVVSPDEGRDLLDDADLAKNKTGQDEKAGKGVDEAKSKEGDDTDGKKAETEDGAEKGEDGDNPDSKKDEGGDTEGKQPEGEHTKDTPDLKTADIGDLLDGVPDERKAEINRRFKESEAAMQPFQSAYAQEQMKQYGATPQEMASRLVELASFANSNPDEYLAWAASQMATTPDKIGDVFTAAAKRFGLKVVPESDGAADDEDLFEDPAMAAMKKENAELKARLNGTNTDFGPDTPERQQQRNVQQTLSNFINEVDETGALKRPFFEQLNPQIAQKAHQHRTATGHPPTMDDLQRFYTEALTDAQKAFGAPVQDPTPDPDPNTPDPSAAQSAAAVSEELKQKAAAAQKAQKASKSVDGSGQGADRRPALAADADLTSVIRHFASQE